MFDTEQLVGDFFLATANKKQEQGSSALLAERLVRPREKDTNSFIVCCFSPGSILVQPILLS